MKVPAWTKKPILKKILLWLGGGTLLFWAAGFLLMPYVVKPVLVNVLSEKLHRPITIREVRINPIYLSARISGLAMTERDGKAPFFGFEELHVNLQAASLLRRAPVIEEISVTAPYLNVVRNADSSYNFADIMEELMKPSESPARYSVNNIQVTGGRIEFDDRPKQAKHMVSDIGLSIPFLSNLSYATDIYVTPTLAAKINGAPLRLAGQSKPFAASRETSIELNLADLNLRPYLEYVPARLNFSVAAAKLDAKLAVSFAQLPGKEPAVLVSGNAALKDVSLSQGKDRPLFSFPLLAVDIRSADIPRKRVSLRSVQLQQPELHVHRDKGGALNLATLVPAGGESKPAPAPETPFSLDAAEIKLSGGALEFADEGAAQPFRTRLQEVNLLVRDFNTAPGKAATVEASLATAGGETIKNNGQVTLTPFAAEGLAEAARLDLKRYAPYYRDQIRFDIEQGALDLSARYRFGDGQLTLSQLSATLGALRLRQRGEKNEFLDIATLTLKDGELDLAKHALTLGEVASSKGTLLVKCGKDGAINLANLAAPSTKAKPAARSTEGAPWQIALKRLEIADYAVKFQDATPERPVTLSADAIKISAEDLSTRKDAKGKLAVRLKLGKTGALYANGAVGINPVAANLKLDAESLALVPLAPYFAEKINITLTDGTVSARGAMQLATLSGGALKASFSGDARVDRLATIDKEESEDFLKWKSLQLRRISAATHPALRLRIDEVALADFYSRLIVHEDGTLNVQDILVKSEQEKAAETAGETASKPTTAQAAPAVAPPPSPDKPQVTIARVSLQNGHVNFHDHFVQPNYSANITNLGGTVTGLSSDASILADVALKGRVDNQGQLDIDGKVNPLSGNLFLDLLAKLTDFELSPLTPYAAKYAGYGIQKGKLSFDVRYHIENRKLSAENHLFLNQLTFGDKVESPAATKMPVLLAVALLKDRKGNIDINLPISGSLDDPKFSLGGIIIKVIVNLILKAVTSPFALIGSLFGGGEELSYLEFDYGSATIAGSGEAKLKNLAKALHDRPALKLDIAGHADPANDAEGLKQLALEHKIKAQKTNELVKKGQPVAAVGEVTIEPAEYARYLTAAYKQEKIPGKPRNLIGMAKDLPVAEMEKLMLGNITVDSNDLHELASRRALEVKEYLVKAGPVESERIYIVAAGAPKPEQEKLKRARVDFALGTK